MPELNFDATQYPQEQQPANSQPKPWDLPVAAIQVAPPEAEAVAKAIDHETQLRIQFEQRLEPLRKQMENEFADYAERYAAYVLYCQTRKTIIEECLSEWHKQVHLISVAKDNARIAKDRVSIARRLEVVQQPRKPREAKDYYNEQ